MSTIHRAPNPLRRAIWPLGVTLLCTLPAAANPVGAPQAATPTAIADPAPPPSPRGEEDKPMLSFGALARATAARASDFGVDPNGTRSGDGLRGESRTTLRLAFDSQRHFGDWSVQAAVAADALVGTFAGKTTAQGDKLPGSRWDDLLLTQAWAGVTARDLAVLRAGVMHSHWGLGLLANDGDQALDERRERWFVLPQVGDRVARAQLVLQPWGRSKTRLRGLFLAASVDQVIEDGTAARSQGDEGWQQVFALRYHFAKERWAGLYYVHRDQRFHDSDGPFLQAHVIDGAFDLDWRKAGAGLRLQGEAVVILGSTDLAPTPEHPEHDVRQSAAVARARWEFAGPRVALEMDGGWFSGDDNLDDVALTGFKASPNFQQGILLFSHVLGWQSGRARLTASDPTLVGYPNADLDRLATGGSVTSAITLFPKVGWKAHDRLEVYGGALLALAPKPPVDPFSTRAVGGGGPRSYLGEAPDGMLLGTEFDLGAAATLAPEGWPVVLDLRAEYAVLLPGGVLAGLADDGPIHGGRLTLSLLNALPKKKGER